MTKGNGFTIKVRNEEYRVVAKNEKQIDIIEYKIAKSGDYVMTVYRNDDGSWCADHDVQVTNEALINEIGGAIDSYEGHV